MNFQEALAQLKVGDKLCRAAWKLEDGFLILLPGMAYVWKIILHPNPNAGNYIFAVEDFEGQDWQRFEMPKELVEVEAIAE